MSAMLNYVMDTEFIYQFLVQWYNDFVQSIESICRGYGLLKTKRIYDNRSEDDGFRMLVDRLWPRGVSKEKANADFWLKDIAPSDGLRRWFAHDEEKWDDFKHRYYKELAQKARLVNLIMEKSRQGNVTLLYGAKNQRFNNAVALKEYIGKAKSS
jgi:uncharacterized protein YeaO (DUF488 family)